MRTAAAYSIYMCVYIGVGQGNNRFHIIYAQVESIMQLSIHLARQPGRQGPWIGL